MRYLLQFFPNLNSFTLMVSSFDGMINFFMIFIHFFPPFPRAVMLIKNDGDVHATPLTEDHKPDNPLEKTRIEEAGGFVYMERLVHLH